MVRHQLLVLGVALLFSFASWVEGSAQTVRATGTTTLQYVELRPLVDDSVAASLAWGEGLARYTEDGRLVRCADSAEFCRFTRSGDVVSTVPGVQDISLSVWGFGQGIRGYAKVRGRTVVSGEDDLWPRSDDRQDVLVAYAEVDRGRLRVRAGRQWKVSGLGYYNYDGGSALLRRGAFSLEGYAGWSLARGLNEPRTSESLAAIESFATEARAHIFGGQVSYRPRTGAALSALYQREIRDDRAGLHSERAALNGVFRRGRSSLEGSLEVDLALRTVNEALIRAWLLPWPALGVGVYGRRYRPFFELWTIWGAFSPVGFDEYGTNAMWSAGRTTVQLRAARREYNETDASSTFGPVRTDGWNVGVSGSTRLSQRWLVQGGFRTDIGFGAAKDNGYVRVQRQLQDDAHVGLHLQAFQRIYEFRVDQGTVIGVGADASLRLGAQARISGSLTSYSHTVGDTSPDVDWSQLRGSLRLDWTLGSEPAASVVRGGAR
jgi:hypothetical protein